MEQASKNLSAAALANLEKWLTDPRYDEFKSEILAKIELGDWLDLESAFYKDLEFGTAGRRGRVGAGPNRLNKITVGESAQALAEYLSLERIKDPAVVIARDVRNSSPELAVAAAEVLVANGVLVYFFDDFRSTPELSFAVRQLRASAGIVISASHNPPSDNGIKIYWSDGGQITSPHDHNLLAIAGKLNDINRIDFLAGVESGKIKIIGAEIDQEYLNNVLLESRSQVRDLKVVFSPLHGAGVTNLLPVLERAGFEVEVVKEQFMADGDFSNVDNQNPNPEAPSARKMAEKILRESQADIALVTDPDADRVAVMSREKSGEIQSFSGNQAAILATNFLLEKAEASQSLEGKFICKSFVTTRALTALADQYSVEIFGDLPVGFKYIAEKILEQKICGKHFLAGFEESYGGLVGDYARDKDAASFGLILAECAAELKAKNQTLGEKLAEIYQKIGWFYDQTIAIDLGDSIEADKPAKIIAQLLNGFEFFSDNPVKKQIVRLKSLPKSGKTADQLRDELSRDINPTEIAALTLEFGSPNQTITIRPSGTEPKMKIYWNWRFDQPKTSGEIQQILEQIKEKVNGCK